MSRDLIVVTHERPEVPAADEWEIDGPAHVEIDDLADAVAAAVLAPRWLVEFHAPHSASKTLWTRVRRAARGIAEACHGAVYDPQEDVVVWPRTARRFTAAAAESRIRVVELEWFLPRSRCVPEAADAFLAATARVLPEARPNRYGEYEPFQGKLAEDVAPFREMFAKQIATPHGGHLFWSSRAPCFGGSAFIDDPRSGGRRPDLLPVGGHFGTRFDGRALDSDARWREAVVDLFVAVARDLGAFYAAGIVECDVIARRGRLSYVASSLATRPNVRTGDERWKPWWQGLPAIPTWLAWFGAPYREEIRNAVAGVEIRGDGVFLRCGAAPMDGGQLVGVFPALPERLVARGAPAESIPPLV